MQNFKKIINPGKVSCYKDMQYSFYIEIEYKDGRLTLHGVVGPMSNGDCKGSCGQNYEKLDCINEYESGWNKSLCKELKEVWQRWHLNDTNPCCIHQRELGWLDKVNTPVTLYHFHLKNEVSKMKSNIEKHVLSDFRKGQTIIPDQEEVRISNLKNFYDSWEKDLPDDIKDFTDSILPVADWAVISV